MWAKTTAFALILAAVAFGGPIAPGTHRPVEEVDWPKHIHRYGFSVRERVGSSRSHATRLPSGETASVEPRATRTAEVSLPRAES